MTKIIPTLLLTTALTVCVAPMASALEISPYVSAKYAYTHMQNDARAVADILNNDETIASNTFVNKELSDNVSGFRLAIGATVPVDAIWGDIRGEVEFAYNMNAKNDGNSTFGWGGLLPDSDITFKNTLRSNVVFLNMYYDIETCSDFIPYIGGGIGYARLRNKAYLVNDGWGGTDKEENFAWNIGAGLGYAVNENITLDLGYRYTDYGTIRNASKTEVSPISVIQSAKYDVTSHEVSLGLRYNF